MGMPKNAYHLAAEGYSETKHATQKSGYLDGSVSFYPENIRFKILLLLENC